MSSVPFSMSPTNCARRTNSLERDFARDFSILGQMTALALTGSKVSLPVTWSMPAQSYTAGRTGSAGLLGV